MNAIFDFKRAGLLIQRYFIERYPKELIFWIISIIVMMFIRNIPVSLWLFAIFACIFRTGFFFREIHSPTNRINYFMIPATQIEKFVVSLLYTIVYFWIAVFVVYVIGNILGTWVNNLLANIGLIANILGFHHSDLSWVLFSSFPNGAPACTILAPVVAILIMQSIFLLGGIYFKNAQPYLTFLALVVIGLFIALISVLEAKYFLADGLRGNAVGSSFNIQINGTEVPEPVKIISQIFFYLLIPFLWLVSYIRLTEKEV